MASSYTLGEHYGGLIKALGSSGRYTSASEVMRDSLRSLEEREQIRDAKLAALRADIRAGLDCGPAEPLDMSEIKLLHEESGRPKAPPRMGFRTSRSPRSKRDLVEIWSFIADDNEQAADRMLDRFEHA